MEIASRELTTRNAELQAANTELHAAHANLRRLADEYRCPEVAEWMLTTIRWAQLMVLTQRQIWTDELRNLPAVNHYLPQRVNLPAGVCLDL